jgi:hypothetical protein
VPAKRLLVAEAALSIMVFVALCVAVLSVAPQVAEPDDGAYHYSIVGITMGYPLTLSSTEMADLGARLHGHGGIPNQWIQLPNGRYLSEKDAGYPFLAAPFQAIGVIRWAPLFFGALACLGLFVGARRWLGRFGGAAAVGLYCSSGAALAFAWRDYMPTFTDASLVAAGSGFLLWSVLATEASDRRRTGAGLAAFLALEVATFARYTDIVMLGCAVLAVGVAWRRGGCGLNRRMVGCWLASVAAFSVGLAVFDDLVYGGPLTTGYRAGEVTFSAAAVGPNLRAMPKHLVQAMPLLVLALTALAWILVRWFRLRRLAGAAGQAARRDLWIAVAIGASWFGVWGLYLAYTWTTDPTSVTVQVARFYVPALGAMSLLGAWLVTRIPGPAWRAGLSIAVGIGVLFGLGVWSFHAMYAAYDVPLG